MTQVSYSFSNWGVYLFWIVPIYGIYKIATLLRGFLCPPKNGQEEEAKDQKSNRQLKKEKAEQSGKPSQRVKY